MKGVIVQISEDPQSGRHFGVRGILSDERSITPANLSQDIFPVPDADIDVRDVGVGSEVIFHTERETGQARIDQPPPARGVRQERL